MQPYISGYPLTFQTWKVPTFQTLWLGNGKELDKNHFQEFLKKSSFGPDEQCWLDCG